MSASTSSTTNISSTLVDPCLGKPKEFFIFEYNTITGQCICTVEQLTFIACYYTDHYHSPFSLLVYLYNVAEKKEIIM